MTRLSAAADGKGGLTRNRPLMVQSAALLIIDVQHYCAFPGEGEWSHIDPERVPEDKRYYFRQIKNVVLPNIKRLQETFRKAGAEVIYTVVESLTKNGRDRSLDYKISGIHVAKGSREARIPDEIKPLEDEMIIPKTASSVFNATNIDYVLRNLEVDYLVITGLITDQCVASAVRDACDRGFLITLVSDACCTYTKERHDVSLRALKGYCRQVTTDALVGELNSLTAKAG